MGWILWWRIDAGELRRQIAQYKTLGIAGSARGHSFLLLVLSAVISAAVIEMVSHDRLNYVDAGIFLVLGLLILAGQRWAIILAMAFWTLEKAIQVVGAVSNFGTTPSATPIVALIWWAVYMHAFYLALRVENGRRNPKRADAVDPEVFS